MKKLLYITTNINNAGGVERILSVKLNYLVEQYGYKIVIFNTSKTKEQNTFFVFDKRIIIHDLVYNSLMDIFKYRQYLNKIIRQFLPDVIINCDNGFKASLVPYLIHTNTPLIFEDHLGFKPKANGITDNLRIKLSVFINYLSLNRYNWIVVLVHPKNKKLPINFKVIPNPLPFNINQNKICIENKTVLALGRFSYVKGYDRLLKIWAIVSKKHADWTLKIYGHGNKEKYLQIAKSLKLENVHFEEPQQDVESIYLSGTLLVNTSRSESFGMANIEALSFGLPVLTFDNVLGPKSYILNGYNGYLIENDNFSDYANKIISLIENKIEQKRMSKEAKKSIKTFEINTIMKQWHALFESI